MTSQTFDFIRDPEVRSEAERIRQGDLLRQQSAYEFDRKCSIPRIGSFPTVSTDQDTEAQALKVVAERRARRQTPEGRYVTALNAVRTALDQAAAAEHEARAAQRRSWTGERGNCSKWADALCDAANALKSAAMDARLVAMSEESQ